MHGDTLRHYLYHPLGTLLYNNPRTVSVMLQHFHSVRSDNVMSLVINIY
jgi:hypothetical protein